MEAELYFVAIQRKDRTLKLTTRIQGLIQLDASFSKEGIYLNMTIKILNLTYYCPQNASSKRKDFRAPVQTRQNLKRKYEQLLDEEWEDAQLDTEDQITGDI